MSRAQLQLRKPLSMDGVGLWSTVAMIARKAPKGCDRAPEGGGGRVTQGAGESREGRRYLEGGDGAGHRSGNDEEALRVADRDVLHGLGVHRADGAGIEQLLPGGHEVPGGVGKGDLLDEDRGGVGEEADVVDGQAGAALVADEQKG